MSWKDTSLVHYWLPRSTLLPMRANTEQDFWKHIDKTDWCPITPLVGGCWLWTAGRFSGPWKFGTRPGYGCFKMRNRNQLAHRLAYQFLRGPIPDGLQLDHLCRVVNCVNPDHLEPVSASTNCKRGRNAERWRALWASGIELGGTAKSSAKTECDHGHPFDIQNTGYYKHPRLGTRPWKYCRECHRTTVRLGLRIKRAQLKSLR